MVRALRVMVRVCHKVVDAAFQVTLPPPRNAHSAIDCACWVDGHAPRVTETAADDRGRRPSTHPGRVGHSQCGHWCCVGYCPHLSAAGFATGQSSLKSPQRVARASREHCASIWLIGFQSKWQDALAIGPSRGMRSGVLLPPPNWPMSHGRRTSPSAVASVAEKRGGAARFDRYYHSSWKSPGHTDIVVLRAGVSMTRQTSVPVSQSRHLPWTTP